MSESKQVAINTRIDPESYKVLSRVCEITNKSITALIKDAVIEYASQVQNPKSKPTKSLQIDQFAWQLHKKGS